MDKQATLWIWTALVLAGANPAGAAEVAPAGTAPAADACASQKLSGQAGAYSDHWRQPLAPNRELLVLGDQHSQPRITQEMNELIANPPDKAAFKLKLLDILKRNEALPALRAQLGRIEQETASAPLSYLAIEYPQSTVDQLMANSREIRKTVKSLLEQRGHLETQTLDDVILTMYGAGFAYASRSLPEARGEALTQAPPALIGVDVDEKTQAKTRKASEDFVRAQKRAEGVAEKKSPPPQGKLDAKGVAYYETLANRIIFNRAVPSDAELDQAVQGLEEKKTKPAIRGWLEAARTVSSLIPGRDEAMAKELAKRPERRGLLLVGALHAPGIVSRLRETCLRASAPFPGEPATGSAAGAKKSD